MGFLARLVIGVGIVYWLAPAPVNYRADYALLQERQRAEAVLVALTELSTSKNASREDIEALAVQAGKALAELDAQTRNMLIKQYFRPDSGASSFKEFIN